METKAEASSISIKKYQPVNFAQVLEAYLEKVPPQKEHLSGADHHQASDEVCLG